MSMSDILQADKAILFGIVPVERIGFTTPAEQ
jgi:hypothetical protein